MSAFDDRDESESDILGLLPSNFTASTASQNSHDVRAAPPPLPPLAAGAHRPPPSKFSTTPLLPQQQYNGNSAAAGTSVASIAPASSAPQPAVYTKSGPIVGLGNGKQHAATGGANSMAMHRMLSSAQAQVLVRGDVTTRSMCVGAARNALLFIALIVVCLCCAHPLFHVVVF